MKTDNLPVIVVATTNKGKLREIKEMFAGLPLNVKSLDDFPPAPEVVENGSSFAENARIKAREYAILTGEMTIADDSGLEVDALNGAPGVFSARYGGKNAAAAEKISLLLSEIAAAPSKIRSARFRCAVAVAANDGNIIAEADATCEGTIVYEPKGNNGFGYDPVFQPDGFDRTFGELSAEIKENISHRALAFRKIKHLWEK